MATKLYTSLTLRTAVEGCAAGAMTGTGFWDWDTAGAEELGQLLDEHGTGVQTQTDATQNGPFTGGISVHCSYPVAAAFTLSGTVTFNLWGLESNGAANAGFVCRLYKLASDGVLTQVVGDSAHGTELGTGAAVRNWTAAPSSTDFAKGDRLVLYWGFTDKGGTMASGHTVQQRSSGTTDGADGDSYVQLTEDVTFDESGTPTGTTLYLTDLASSVDQGVVEKVLSDARDDGVVSAVRNTATGPIALAANQWTETAGGTAIEWYSKRLSAFTLQGKVYVKVRGQTSSGTSLSGPVAELAVCNADGSGAVVWARSALGQASAGQGYTLAFGTSEGTRDARLAGPDLAVANGQRLRLRIYCDENYLIAGGGPQVAGATATIFYGASSGGGSGDSFITLGETLEEFIPPDESLGRSFANSLDRLATAAFTPPSGPISLSFWMEGTPLTSRNIMAAADGNLKAASGAAGELTFARTFSGGLTTWTAAGLTFTGQHHYCWTHDGTTADPILYQDGVAKTVGDQTPSGSVLASSQVFLLGGGTAADSHLGAALSALAMRDIALSPAQVQRILLCEKNVGNLAAHWPIENENPEPDRSGNGRDATGTGTTVVTGPAGVCEEVQYGYRRISGPHVLTTSAVALYSAPAGTKVQIRRIWINNPGVSTVKPTLSIGTDAADTRIINLEDILAGSQYDGRHAADLTLDPGETIFGYTDTGSPVIVITGYLEQA